MQFSTPVFRPGLLAEIILSLLRLERKQKNSSNPFRIHMFLFLSYSFGIEAINTFINTRAFLENHIRFQTKMGKAYPFSDQNGVKPVADGAAHTYIDYIRGYSLPPPHPPWQKCLRFVEDYGKGSLCNICHKMLTVIWGYTKPNTSPFPADKLHPIQFLITAHEPVSNV